jgi:murein L,D-transpeptidase YafK
MRKISAAVCFIMIISNYVAAAETGKDFLSSQKEYPRVRKAFADKNVYVNKTLAFHNVLAEKADVLIIAFKAEAKLEVYAKNKEEDAYKKISVYDIAASSGKLGPKRRQGDMQVPEGFYRIDRFNPSSAFYLSLGINYPNKSDRKKSSAPDLGGDIFIHGSNATIGCIPITDDKIKEIYVLAVYAKNGGQTEIPVYIFPFEMTGQNMKKYAARYSKEPALVSFWENLKTGYDEFQSKKRALKISVDAKGNYVF